MTVMQFLFLVACITAEVSNSPQYLGTSDNTIEDIDGKNEDYGRVYEGDIILTEDEADDLMGHKEGERSKRQAPMNHTRLWPNGVVYYSFNKTEYEKTKTRFRKAAKLWSAESCVSFEENDTATDRVVIDDQDYGCGSVSVGRRGGKQDLILGQACYSVGRVAHEIGHVLGMFHTQSRPDRDQHVNVIGQNILEVYWSQFVKYNQGSVNTYNLSYDYGSIMHYSAESASKNGSFVMVPKPDKRYLQTLGSPIISFYDKLFINLHYGCLNKCVKWFRRKCQNGGFRNPKDCSKCVCPSGYGGDRCNKRPSGCGAILKARTWNQTLNDTVGRYDPGDDNDEFIMCNYWIEAIPGSTIEVTFVNYSRNEYSEGCKYSGVEIKTGNDKRQTGYRLCDRHSAGTTFNSTNHIVPVITYATYAPRTTILSYRIVASDPKMKCRDNALCKFWKKPCNETDPGEVRRRLCPKSCGYCL